MASLFLIRHAQPTLTGVMLGQLDPPLSEMGRDQAAALAGLAVSVAWSSPLCRARQTAEYIGCEVVEVPELREIDQGEWTGKTWSEIETNWSDHAARKCDNWLGISAPGGETWTDFLTRIETVWKRIRTGPAPAAVVAHQGVNAGLVYLIQGRDPLAFTQQYGEMIEIDFD